MTARRAYDSAAKEARRQDILDAAERLFAANGDQLPSVGDIAAAANLAKGTVYLYFGTKEEIFAILLLDGWSRVVEVASRALADEADDARAVERFLASFVKELVERPMFLRLDTMGKAVLEVNMTAEALAAFKAHIRGQLEAAGAILEGRLRLEPGRGAQLLVRTHAMMRGLWQSFGLSPSCANASSPMADRFPAELLEALTEYWRGALQG